MISVGFEMVDRTLIRGLCGARDAALTKLDAALEAFEQAHASMDAADQMAQMAHGGACFVHADHRDSDFHRMSNRFDVARARASYRKQLDARAWNNVMILSGMRNLMDRATYEEFLRSLMGEVPEFTEDNARATFEGLAEDATLIFQRGLARAFIELDRRFKSHDAFQIGSRVILTRMFDEHGSRSHHTMQTLVDIERSLAVLDKQSPEPEQLRESLRASRKGSFNPHQSTTETRYFRINGFKNGNAHLWFARDDLIYKANQVLADYYGAVLPDGVAPDATPAQTTALCRDLSFYPTPPAVLRLILSHTYVRGLKVLEPSAGDGAMVEALRQHGAEVDAIEVDPNRCAAMRRNGMSVLQANFLQVPHNPVYDMVCMNPPFYGTHWMNHVMHAAEFLRPGGKLVAVLPVTADLGTSAKHQAFHNWLKQYRDARFHDLPAESFAASGTRVSTVYLTLSR